MRANTRRGPGATETGGGADPSGTPYNRAIGRLAMAARRRTDSLLAYPRKHAENRDVEFGASARRRRRRRWIVACVGVSLIGGAWRLYRALLPSETPVVRGDRHPVKVRCAACGHEAVMLTAADQTFPVVCSNCKQRGAYELWRCRSSQCGKEFVPRKGEDPVRCPHCNGTNVGAPILPEP